MRFARLAALATLALALLGAPLAADAQPAGKVPQIGYLYPGSHSATRPHPLLQGFRDGLHELGWVEGRTITIEWSFADLKPDRLPMLAAGLVDQKVDAIVAVTNLAAFPAKQATATIPIVVLASHDALGTGLVASLAKPEANVTGMESMAPELDAKRLERRRSKACFLSPAPGLGTPGVRPGARVVNG
jgi:putative tryptophan/tyrosine transport system substrate-binding protein